MATVLQCPDCGQDQPLEQISGMTFRCRRCGRLLAAPRLPARAVVPPPADSDDDRTVAVAPVAREWRPARPPPQLPAPLRALVWVLALVVGLVLAAAPLRAIGWLSVDDVLDAFAGSGLGRWGILLVFLPLWAGISGSLAHFALEALTRRRLR
jgi:hypothetical protein